MKRLLGFIALGGFLASIPVANWWLDTHGFYDAPVLGPVPSGLWVVAIAFVLRDLAQLLIGKSWTLLAIAAGALLSWWLASPELAVASASAFGLSELLDFTIYTPLAERGRFAWGVALSGLAASLLDSALFLFIAFGSTAGWWQMGVAKALIVLAATPVAWVVRRCATTPTPARLGFVTP